MNCSIENAGVREFCVSVSASSTFSLKLLRDIDNVVDFLGDLEKNTLGILAIAERYLRLVRECVPKNPLDPDDSIKEVILNSEQGLAAYLGAMKNGLKSAHEDDDLRGEHKDTVTSSYESATDAAQRLHDVMAALRWAIMEHDADTEPDSGKRYSTANEMLKALNS